MTAAAAEPSDDDELPVDVRIAAAVTLTTDTPSPTALALLEDRRIAHLWRLGLSLAGFALLTMIALATRRIDGPVQLLVTLVALGAALGGGLRGWFIDRRRLMARTADAALPRRERSLLLAGIHRGRQSNRTPVPLLRELARWRVDTAVPDVSMTVGAATAFYLPGVITDGASWWRVLGGTVIVVLVAASVFLALRERERCRRFLDDSAGWPSAGGHTGGT